MSRNKLVVFKMAFEKFHPCLVNILSYPPPSVHMHLGCGLSNMYRAGQSSGDTSCPAGNKGGSISESELAELLDIPSSDGLKLEIVLDGAKIK